MSWWWVFSHTLVSDIWKCHSPTCGWVIFGNVRASKENEICNKTHPEVSVRLTLVRSWERQQAKSQCYLSSRVNTHVSMWQWPLTDGSRSRQGNTARLALDWMPSPALYKRLIFVWLPKHSFLRYWNVATVWVCLLYTLISFSNV